MSFSYLKKVSQTPFTAHLLVWTAIYLIVIDRVYANFAGVNLINRETQCILFTSMPRWAFLILENIVELSIVVLIGVFASVIIEKYFLKIDRFLPKNQFTAFLYGSALPVCSCGAIPLIDAMKQKISLKVIVTFIVSAPLLNPYTIVLSLSILGIRYCILRVLSSFALAIVSGYVVEWIGQKYLKFEVDNYKNCAMNCTSSSADPFVKTVTITKKLLPFILIGGALGLSFELLNPKQILTSFNFNNQWVSVLIMAVIGIPIYVCNGADILLLKPMLLYTDLPVGSAMVFSLSSSAVCISSMVMLSKYFGKKLTMVLTLCIGVTSVLIGYLINIGLNNF